MKFSGNFFYLERGGGLQEEMCAHFAIVATIKLLHQLKLFVSLF